MSTVAASLSLALSQGAEMILMRICLVSDSKVTIYTLTRSLLLVLVDDVINGIQDLKSILMLILRFSLTPDACGAVSLHIPSRDHQPRQSRRRVLGHTDTSVGSAARLAGTEGRRNNEGAYIGFVQGACREQGRTESGDCDY